MPQILQHNSVERRAEKERQREADALALVRGEISREELSRQNGMFSSLKIVGYRARKSDFRR